MRAFMFLMICFIINNVSAKPKSASDNETQTNLGETSSELKRIISSEEDESSEEDVSSESSEEDESSEEQQVSDEDLSSKLEEVRLAFMEALSRQEEDDERKYHYFTRGGNLEHIETDGTSDEIQFIDDAFDVSSRDYLRFSVRACSGAYIILAENSTFASSDDIEIAIDRNVPSHVETATDGFSTTIKTNTPNRLDCESYRTFMINWARVVQLWFDTEVGWELVVQTPGTSSQVAVGNIGFRTLGTEGNWRVVKDYTTGPTTVITTNRIHYLQKLSQDPWPLVQDPSVIFDVVACSSARTVLSVNGTNDGILYDVIIDFNGKKSTQIRKTDGLGGRSRVDYITYNEHILDCNEQRRFFLSWRKSRIQLMQQTGDGWNTLLYWQDSEDNEKFINYVGFGTDSDIEGVWHLDNYFETAIDTLAGDSTPQSMAGLNDLDTNLGEINLESRRATLSLDVTKILLENPNGNFESFEDIVADQRVLDEFEEHFGCEEEIIECDENAKFRTISGKCNNLLHPLWGSALTPQLRLLNPDYDDGISAVRNQGLPSAREVSRAILSDPRYPDDTPVDDNRTLLMMMMGQFYDHDMIETPMEKGKSDTTIGCCGIQDEFIRRQRPQCADIKIGEDDPDFEDDCMNFVRSTATKPEGRKCFPVNHRQQLNAVTSFIDGSMIYGSEEEIAHALRANTSGFMLVSRDNLLPGADSSDKCVTDNDRNDCFFAGDVRVNEQPGLTVMHTIWVRYHNCLAKEFNNQGITDDNLVYNIVRKIIGAILQLILYDGWLRQVLTPEIMDKYGLTVGMPYTYDESINPSIANQFGAASFRYGHTLISRNITALNEDYFHLDANEPLENNFFRPDLVYEYIDGVGRWMMTHRCRKADRLFAPSIHKFLFLALNGVGMDLGSLNIQRGRDHGIPPYYKWREFCGLSKVESFGDLVDHHPMVRKKFSEIYNDVKDIDLFPAGVSEYNLEGGHLGPTMSCLLAKQFHALKFGDRYWFENPEPIGFTTEQLENIKEMTLGSVMCKTLNIERTQKNVFLAPLPEEWIDCSETAQINVTLFIP